MAMVMNLKKDLQGVNKELMTLAKKVEKLIVAFDKLQKPKAAKKTKPAKEAPVKKTGVQKTKMLPAHEIVFSLIKRSTKGVDTAALIGKTGYNQKKIFNVIYKLKQQGKIKSLHKGIYVKA
jgi:predicted Rossmann fold nucleotide-binding protein DprA/Smf involved in DNA uptake